MAYDLQEQDQLDAFKAYWNKYGNFLLTVVTVVLLAIAGWRGWGWWQQKQAAEASVLYEQLRDAVERKDVGKVKQSSGPLFEKYSGTIYGSMGALLAARAYHDAGDLKGAKAPLQWACPPGPAGTVVASTTAPSSSVISVVPSRAMR